MKLKIWGGTVIICSVLAWIGCDYFKDKLENIHIAVAGPPGFNDAVNLYVDEVNENGGIGGKKIIADYFDDQNNPNTAPRIGVEIAKKNQAVAVIGHYQSNCSMSAGTVYKEHSIPAITPTSAVREITIGNEWYFRTAFTDTYQGRFLAIYAKNILKENVASIIYDDGRICLSCRHI